MIQHTVAFRLEEAVDHDAFWRQVATLEGVAGVRRFQVLRQIGLKNDFTHALSMYFETQADYDAYDAHPDHVAFVAEAWLPSVAEFIELDYAVDEN